jgi:hypothetical protein
MLVSVPGTGEQPGILIIDQPYFRIVLAIVIFIIITTVVSTPIMWKYRLNILLWRHGHLREESG